MLQAFILVLREGFESFLIVAIVFSYLQRTGRARLLPVVGGAIVFSLFLSVIMAFVLLKGVNQAFWEGVLGLVTVVMVGSLVYHMWRIAPRLKQNIQAGLDAFASGGSTLREKAGVFLFTSLMITREGMETALMLLQVREGNVLGGIFLGLAATLFVAFLWVRYSSFINLKRFFQVTGVFLVVFMFQVLLYSLHEFSESGVFPNSEDFHIATEPFSPVGVYGQWFSPLMVAVCALWLIAGQVADRFKPQLSPKT